MALRAWLRLTLVSLLAIGALAVILRGTDWSAFLATLAHIRPESVVVVMALQSLALAGRGIRWWSLLTTTGPLPLGLALGGTAIGAIGNHCLPARGGELLRAHTVGKTHPGGMEFVLGTIVIERILGAILLGIITCGVVLAWPGLPQTVLEAALTFLATGAVIIAVLTTWPKLEHRAEHLAVKLIPSWLTRRLGPSCRRALASTSTLRHPHAMILFLSASLAVWIIDIVAVLILGESLGISFSPGEGFLFLAGTAMSGAIPALPGNLGVYELTALAVLSPLHIPAALGLAFALTYKGIGILQTLIWGGMAWFVLGLKHRPPIRDKDTKDR